MTKTRTQMLRLDQQTFLRLWDAYEDEMRQIVAPLQETVGNFLQSYQTKTSRFIAQQYATPQLNTNRRRYRIPATTEMDLLPDHEFESSDRPIYAQRFLNQPSQHSVDLRW